jgi:hypothetical protein
VKKVKKVKKEKREQGEKTDKKGGKFKREKCKGGGGERIRNWDKELKLINVVLYGEIYYIF